jgi:GntR family transcriptional regulator
VNEEGPVEEGRSRGTAVRGPRTPAVRDNLRHQWEKDRARASRDERAETGATERDTGLDTDDLVFHARYREITASEDLAAAFGVPEGTLLLERVYRTSRAGAQAPLSLVTSYLVRDMVASNPDLLDEAKEPWPGGTQNQLYTVGIEVDRVEERVTARPPTPEEARELDLPAGVPVLLLRKTYRDVHDRVVNVSDVTMPADRTELLFVTRLERW